MPRTCRETGYTHKTSSFSGRLNWGDAVNKSIGHRAIGGATAPNRIVWQPRMETGNWKPVAYGAQRKEWRPPSRPSKPVGSVGIVDEAVGSVGATHCRIRDKVACGNDVFWTETQRLIPLDWEECSNAGGCSSVTHTFLPPHLSAVHRSGHACCEIVVVRCDGKYGTRICRGQCDHYLSQNRSYWRTCEKE